MHHPKTDTEHHYIKRENDGIQQELTDKTTSIGSKKYLDTKTGWMLQSVNTYKKQKKNIHFVEKAINLQNNSTPYWKK